MSASCTSSTTDLAEKFQRLTKEYLKVKDMCKVLSAGVNAERSKTEKLEYDFKEKEAQLRKIIAEKEAVEFHNSQLTKRIELLREELEKKPPVIKKKKLKPGEVNTEELYNKIKILEDELYNKLNTNESLIHQIADMETRELELLAKIEEYKGKVSELTFIAKAAPIVASMTADSKNGFKQTNGLSNYASSFTQNGSAEEKATSPLIRSDTLKSIENIVVKFDVAVQVDEELNNNNKSLNKENLKGDKSIKQAEIDRLTENIRKLEDIKEKQSLDITLLKKKLELSGNSAIGMDSAEQATKLARIRIREVMNEKEEAQQTAHYYEKEVRNLLVNIKGVMDSKKELEIKISELMKDKTNVAEELISVRKSYDAQLAQMSDMVIELNHKYQPVESVIKTEVTTPTSRSIRNFFSK